MQKHCGRKSSAAFSSCPQPGHSIQGFPLFHDISENKALVSFAAGSSGSEHRIRSVAAILRAGRKREAVLWKGGGSLSCGCSGSTRGDTPGVLEGDHELPLRIKCCRFLCVWECVCVGKQPCEIHWDLPQMGNKWKRKGKSFWCAGEEDHPICNAGAVTNKYCICLLLLTWHWKSLINLRNNDLCSKHVQSNHICLYHKFWFKCFRAFLKAMSLEYVGKRLLLVSCSMSERCGKGMVGCSCKVLSCTSQERWSS